MKTRHDSTDRPRKEDIVSPKEEFVNHLEIAVDMLDRVEGTTIYDIQKKAMGWSDKDYSKMLDQLAIFLLQVKNNMREE